LIDPSQQEEKPKTKEKKLKPLKAHQNRKFYAYLCEDVVPPFEAHLYR